MNNSLKPENAVMQITSQVSARPYMTMDAAFVLSFLSLAEFCLIPEQA